MNPPFHDARRQNVSPDPRRRLAHVGAPGLLGRWVDTAAWLLKARGVVTLIWRADGLDEVLEALGRSFGDISVLAVLPRAGAPAIRVLVRAVKGGGGTRVDYPALALNDESGQPTAAVEAVLRQIHVAQARKTNNATDQHEQECDLGIHRSASSKAPAPTILQKAFQS
jgi:tRNA1(Val) A37 N6-methylase TrmN6